MFFNNNCLERSDSTLTVQHLLTALQGVADWKGLGMWLDVPRSRRDVMTGKESMLEEWLQNHPAPSWKLVAWALYRKGRGQLTEHNVLKQLYGKHVTGMWLCTEIISGTIPHCIKQWKAVQQIKAPLQQPDYLWKLPLCCYINWSCAVAYGLLN